MIEPVEGGCLCGAVRYRANGEPDDVFYCHCSMCRRATGQPVVVGAYFKQADVAFVGEARRHRSSPQAERGFCGTCGTPLFYHSVMPELRDWFCLMLGTFDHPERYAPTGHWNVETALPFALSDDGLPRHNQRDSTFAWVRDSAPPTA